MLRPFAHPLVCCCVFLGDAAQSLKAVKLWATMLGVVGSVCTLLKKGWHFMVQELVQILLNLIWV